MNSLFGLCGCSAAQQCFAVQQCTARAAVVICSSAYGGVNTVHGIVCSSALGMLVRTAVCGCSAVWQYAAVQQCAAVFGSVRGRVWHCA
jgi:hypothetical protein